MKAKLYEFTAWENEDGYNESIVLIEFNPPNWIDAIGVASERCMRGCSDTYLLKSGGAETTNDPEKWEIWGERWMAKATKRKLNEVDFKYQDFV